MELLLINKSPRLYRTYPYHTHKSWEVILCMEGEGTALIAGRVYPFCPGTIFCIPPGTPHKKTAERGYTDGCMFLDGFEPLAAQGVAVCEDDAANSFARLFELTFETSLRGGPNAKGIVQALVLAMYQLLAGWCGEKRRRNAKVEGFEKLLMENLSDPGFDLGRAMDGTGYSRNHFRSLFKACVGMAPVEYLRRLRMEYAKQNLRRSRGLLSVAEIARMCGFSDPYYFSRVFTRYEGVSPRGYLRSLEREDGVSLVFAPAPQEDSFSEPCYTRWHELVRDGEEEGPRQGTARGNAEYFPTNP